MNDRIPGSCWHNPIYHRNYRIYLSDLFNTHGYLYDFVHNDYDGAYNGHNNRCGQAHTVEEAKKEIDELEDNE